MQYQYLAGQHELVMPYTVFTSFKNSVRFSSLYLFRLIFEQVENDL